MVGRGPKAERDRARDYRSCFKLVIRCNLRIALDRAIDRHNSVGLSRSTLAKMMHFYWPSLEAFTAARWIAYSSELNTDLILFNLT